MSHFPELYGGEDYLVGTMLFVQLNEDPILSSFTRFNLGGSGASSLLAAGATLAASLMLF